MRDALLYIVSGILDKGDLVEVLEDETDGIINFTVKVPKDEMGKVIGKEGKVIKAIRNVVKIPAIREGKRINITLEELSS